MTTKTTHQTYCQQGDLKLLFAENSDRRLIYDMAFEDDEIWQSMIACKEQFPWSEIRDEKNYFFSSLPSKNKYYLIKFKEEIIGTISHTHNNAPIENMELDLWLRSRRFTGQGLGTAVLNMLIEKLHDTYAINTFIIRPWLKNQRAIAAYAKCGFCVQSNFNPRLYYAENLEEYGDGDFGTETTNMVLTYSGKSVTI